MVEPFKERRQFFELVSKGKRSENNKILKVRRALVGSSETCDVVLDYVDISPIHAVIEIKKEGFFLYDMNSKTGSYINDEKIVKEQFEIGDKLKFGEHEFTFKKYKKRELPPVLDIIDPTVPPILDDMPAAIPEVVKTTDKKEIKKAPPIAEEKVESKVQYPLGADPNAQFSEYIFEDTDQLLPIFKYEIDKQAVEVVILFKGRIYSVDYLPKKDGKYYFVGRNPKENEVEFVHLGIKERVEFLKIVGDSIYAYHFEGYKASFLSDGPTRDPKKNHEYPILDDDILILRKNDLEIFIRRTDRPPKVKSAPILSKDKDLNKFLVIMYIVVAVALGLIFNVEVDKEKEKEKDPERIATILYKKKPKKLELNKQMTKTEKVPEKVVQKAEPKPTPVSEPKKQEQKQVTKKPTPSPPKKVVKVAPPKKASPNKGPETVKKDLVAPKIKTVSAQKPAGPKLKTVAPPKAVVKKSLGRVDAYKSIDFKSSLSSLMAKGGSTASVAKVNVGGGGGSLSGLETVKTGATLKSATVTSNVGSLSGVVSGKIDATSGVKGIVDKKTIYTAGIPDKTVVLGSMDPDVIRRILREHLPQFRYCYQKVLDRASQSFSGVVEMNFIIGASGNVTRAGVNSANNIPNNVRSCVVNVLRGIKFPAPLGGGEVEVNQPFNFYPVNK